MLGEITRQPFPESAYALTSDLRDNTIDSAHHRLTSEPQYAPNRCIAGAVGFSVRENQFYVFKAKAVMALMGGAVHVFKPRSAGEGLGRAWYPPWNSGSSLYFTAKAGAEQTCQEIRF